jgi:hypothetical protein
MNNAFIDVDSTNFSHLIVQIPDKIDQLKYTDKWRHRYVKAFKDVGPISRFLWAIRVHKSLKEAFTSAAFYQESLIAKESNCWSSFYFRSYYSLFHALMSCVCCVPEESIESLAGISHKKLLNVFESNFVGSKPNIVREDISTLFPMLKYFREYYSYKMPPNDFLYEDIENVKPDRTIPYFIRNCVQVASLHSEIICEVANKHGGEFDDRGEHYSKLVEWYGLLNCPKHPKSNEFILDFTDNVKIDEIYKYPEPVSFITDFEHFTDEFRNYSGSESPTFKNGTPIRPPSFIYNTIFR